MDTIQRQLVKKYIDLFFRRKIFIITVLLLSLPIGLGIYLHTPKVYQASSLLSYQQQKISPNKLSPDRSSKVRDIVNTLTQIVTSRTNLEQIIKELDLYSAQRERLPIEDVVEMLRTEIQVIPSKRGEVFTISYSSSQPDKIVRVTNAIAAKFIEENLKYRHERAMDTSSYTNEELQMAKQVMDRKESVMRDYKLKNYNEMPQHRQANLSRVISLQGQYQAKQESIQDLERTLVLIQDQLNNRKMLVQRSAGAMKNGDELDSYQRLANYRSSLDTFLLKYTEKHPEIIRLRKLIAKLEVEIQGGGTAKNGSTAVSRSSSTNGVTGQRAGEQAGIYDKILMQLEVQKKSIKLNIANLENEKAQLREKIELYEKWVSAAPVREAEWSSLTREYDQLKKHYDYLVAQNLRAESMLNLEVRQKGSQFKIEDPARYSGKPIKPNFMRIMAMSVMVGLGFGLVVVFVSDFFDSSIRDPETLSPLLGIPLLVSIPHIDTEAEQKKVKWQRLATVVLLLLGSGGVVALFAFVWARGDIIL